MSIRLVCVAGARPNFMKLAPLFRELAVDPDFRLVLVHTGQHYDDRMSGWFLRDLGLPEPVYNLEVGSDSHAQQTARIMERFEPVVLKEKPDAVVVVGDVNSTMACALVAKKLNIRVVHVEAGLRSFDREMPEEINRVVTDSITDLFLVTEQSGRLNLVKEGIPEERIHLVGNLMIDSLYRHIDTARKSDVTARLHIGEGSYGVVTLHRPSNVDDAAQLCDILSALGEVSRDIPLYFPVHPRTRGRMPENWPGERIHLIEPLGYFDFLCLVLNSAVVFTDSGGIQEETTVLGVPCITIRNNTERPATVEEGTNILAGTSQAGILKAWREVLAAPRAPRVPPLWDGQASSRCRAALRSFFGL